MKNKKDDKFSYALGITLTFELLNFRPKDCVSVYIHSKFTDANSFEKLINLCKEKNIEVIYSDKIFNVLSNKENCYVIGEFTKYNSELENDNHVVLVNPSDAGNMGTIMRSSLGFGIKNIAIIKPAVDIFNPKVVRSSMGALFGINVKYYDSFEDYQNEFKDHNIYTLMLQAKVNLSEVENTNQKYSLVFGNEATGLPKKFLNIGTPVIIKHTSNIDSLNLPIAVSITLYEFTKHNFK